MTTSNNKENIGPILDLYATTVLSSLLSNDNLITALCQQAQSGEDKDTVPKQLTKVAFHYAEHALKLRSEIIQKNTKNQKQ